MNQRENVKCEIQKVRLVNFRPLFYGFLAFAIGIAFSYYVFSLNISYIILLTIGFLFVVGLSIFKKQFINFLLIIICFIGGVGAFFIDSANFTSQKFSGKTCEVVAVVSTNIYETDDYSYMILHDVNIDGKSSKNLALSVYNVGSNTTFEAGMKIKFSTQIYDEFLFENDEFNSFAYKMNATHNAFVYNYEVEVLSGGNLTLAENVRLYVKNLLHKYMPFETAELSYSILFGDQTQLDSQIKENFSTSGLGHLVAVSGLNIAVLVACLYWMLKKCKCVGLPRFVVVAVILLFYCYLCSWAPSVVRATIMALVFLGFALLGRQYDILSSLGIAGFIILIFKPFSVYDAGFLMSFLSVIAIRILVRPATNLLHKKCKIPEKIANALAIDITTTLAILPVLALYFGKLSFFSWLTNLICVPLFSLAYIMVFALVIIVSLFSFLGFLLWIPNILMQFIIWFSGVIAHTEWAIITLYTFSIIGAVAFMLVLFFSSNIFMGKMSQKLTAISTSVVMALILVAVVDVPKNINSNTYTQLNSLTPCAVMTSKTGDVLVVCDDDNTTYLEEYLMAQNITYVNTWIVSSGNVFVSEEDNAVQKEFVKKYGVKNIVNQTSSFSTFGDFGVWFIYQNGNTKAVYLTFDDGTGVLVALNHIGSQQAVNIRNMLAGQNVQALYESRQSLNFESVWNFNKVFSSEKIEGVQNNYATKIVGNFTFSVSNGIMS